MPLHIYLPQDRLRALAQNRSLPERTNGAALFADIGGFTALTEALRDALGPRRGAEELTKRLQMVYSALIAKIEEYGGSVIDFAGDSMMCWFDAQADVAAPDAAWELGADESVAAQSPSHLAVACAFALQRSMRPFARITLPDRSTLALTLKVAIATGAARRFVVGNAQIRRIDALAGATVARAAQAERWAQPGEIVSDAATAAALGAAVALREWRGGEVDGESGGERFTVLEALTEPIEPPLLAALDLGYLSDAELAPWLDRVLVERERAGQGSFQTEFRPCTAVFVRFNGIDYDADAAGEQLDLFVRTVQDSAARYDGTLLALTIGDKGSYVYLNFGVFTTHEDDARRAVRAALALRAAAREMAFLEPLQIGIAQGSLRVGAYGGGTRKTFGAMGDEVNLAARLMTNAAPGEILVSGPVQHATRGDYASQPRAPLALKGKAEPLPVFALTEERRQRAIRLQEPDYALPMVGREEALARVDEQLQRVLQGQGQVVGIVAEAGLGKSRLVAEVIRLARRMGFVGYGGACQSDGLHTPYLAWKSVWQAFFDIDHEAPLKRQLRLLEGEIEDRAPTRVEALPLLNGLLDLQVPDNEFTRTLEPEIRQSALHALLEDCLKAQAAAEPVLIVLEDLHWIDAASHDLLEQLARALANHRVAFVLAYRPPQGARLAAPRLEALPQFTRIELRELSRAEAEPAIRAKLAQLYPSRTGGLPPGLVDGLMARAQGNPFYLEELLNYLHDRSLDPSQIGEIALPDSLHALILSRIDQLTEREKTTLRAASIVGRQFRAGWLAGYYPALGQVAHVKLDLDRLDALDITPLDVPEPELQYLFKHIVTHEVTYESLPFALRAQLHEQLARYLEGAGAAVDSIAHHYLRSGNQSKQREYLLKAGEAAQKDFANEAAIEYYGALLPLLQDEGEKLGVHLRRGQVRQLLGHYDDAEGDYRAALDCARADSAAQAEAQLALGRLHCLRGDYEAALGWLEQARQACLRPPAEVGLAAVLIEIGTAHNFKGEYELARGWSNQGLALARAKGDRVHTARALQTLADADMRQGHFATASARYAESLAIRREIGDKGGMAQALNGLANVARPQADFAATRALLEESLALWRSMGGKRGMAIALSNLGTEAGDRGDYAVARAFMEESLSLSREIGEKALIGHSLGSLGNVALAQGDFSAARTSLEASLTLRREVGGKWGIAMSLSYLGSAALAQGAAAEARALYEESLALCREMDEKGFMAMSLLGLGLANLADDRPGARASILSSLRLNDELGEQLSRISSLVGVTGLVLHEGRTRLAAQLLGAVAAALKALQGAMEAAVVHIHAQTLAQTRAALGEAAFQAAFDEGGRWTLDQTVRRVLDETDGMHETTGKAG